MARAGPGGAPATPWPRREESTSTSTRPRTHPTAAAADGGRAAIARETELAQKRLQVYKYAYVVYACMWRVALRLAAYLDRRELPVAQPHCTLYTVVEYGDRRMGRVGEAGRPLRICQTRPHPFPSPPAPARCSPALLPAHPRLVKQPSFRGRRRVTRAPCDPLVKGGACGQADYV